MATTTYVLVNPKTGSVEVLDNDSFIVPVTTDSGLLESAPDEWFLNAADNPHATVIPVIEHLEWSDD